MSKFTIEAVVNLRADGVIHLPLTVSDSVFKYIGSENLKITIERNVKRRSNAQNRYYRSILEKHIQPGLYNEGYEDILTPEDAHEVCKALFLRRKREAVNQKTGEVIALDATTKKLSTIEFNEYIERLIQWGAEFLHIQIPYPNEKFI